MERETCAPRQCDWSAGGTAVEELLSICVVYCGLNCVEDNVIEQVPMLVLKVLDVITTLQLFIRKLRFILVSLDTSSRTFLSGCSKSCRSMAETTLNKFLTDAHVKFSLRTT